jgi:hypothetical protein
VTNDRSQLRDGSRACSSRLEADGKSQYWHGRCRSVTRRLLLAYYVGAYGPTIRIDSQSREDLAAVGQLFRRLASGAVREADFGQALGCRLDSIGLLMVRWVKSRSPKALELQYYTAGQPVFHWSNTGEEWLEDAEKVDVLAATDAPGHQYLTREGVDDAVVELCFRE